MVNFNSIFEHFGGQNKLAGILDVSTQAISAWKYAGCIPANNAVEIERITDGKFKAVDLVAKRGN